MPQRLSLLLTMLLSMLPISARAEQPVPGEPETEGVLEVDVLGGLLRTSENDTTAVTHFDRADLAWPGLSTADVLAAAPSVSVARTGGSSDLATVTLRGATSAETPIYFGPILLNDDLTGTADLSTLPPWLLSSIDVYRGHAPIELERSGLGGAVILRPFIPSGTHVGIESGVGSFRERSLHANGSVGRDGSAAMVALNLSQTQGNFAYLDDRGTRFEPSDDRELERKNGDARALDIWTAAHLELGGAHVDALFRGYEREQGVPGLGTSPALRARAKTRNFLGALSAQAVCSVGCLVEAAVWGRASRYQLVDPDQELPFAPEYRETSAMSTGARVGFSLSPRAWLLLKAGAALGFASVSVDPLGEVDKRARRSDVRAYLSIVAKPTEWLTARLEGSVASDHVSSELGSAEQQTPTGRIGVAVHPLDGLSFFATAGRYGRVPTLGEQFGIGATVLGNERLRPESGLSLDVGGRGELSAHRSLELAAELLGFARTATDRIVYERSSFAALRPFNLDSTFVLGLEASAAVRLFRLLEAGGAFTATDARDTSDGRTTVNDRLPFASGLAASPFVALRLRDLVPQVHWDRATLRSLLIYRDSRTADPAGLIRLPSQVLLDLEGSVGFDEGSVELAGRLSNVLGDRTTDLVGYPLPGRAGHLSLRARWR